jgi:hypothetical protein
MDFYLTLGENSFLVSKNCKNYFVHTFMDKYMQGHHCHLLQFSKLKLKLLKLIEERPSFKLFQVYDNLH